MAVGTAVASGLFLAAGGALNIVAGWLGGGNGWTVVMFAAATACAFILRWLVRHRDQLVRNLDRRDNSS